MKSIIQTINESKDQVYFNSFSEAVQYARKQIENRGFEIDEDDWFSQINTGQGRPKNGSTTKATIGLLKNGKPQRKALHISVSDRGTRSNSYELNYYVL